MCGDALHVHLNHTECKGTAYRGGRQDGPPSPAGVDT